MSDKKQPDVSALTQERMIRADANMAIARVAIEQAIEEARTCSDTDELIELRVELLAISDRVGRATITAARIRHGVGR